MPANSFDTIIVGAGVLGAFHAYHACLRNKKVLLLEKDGYPTQATVRNFGQIVPSGLKGEWFENGKRSVEIYQSIQKEFDISIRQNGSAYIASDEEEVQLLHELHEKMSARDYSSEILSTRECLEKWPSLKKEYCKEAIFFPSEISAEPDKLIHRLIEYLKRKFENFIYLPNCPIVGCDYAGTQVQVTSSRNEKFVGDKLILCNGAEFKLLFPNRFDESGIVISKLQMLCTVPLKEVLLPGNILTGLTIRRYESFSECPSFSALSTPEHLAELKKWGIHILFKQAVDGSIIIGDSHEYASHRNVENLDFEIKDHINQLILVEAQRVVQFNVNQISSIWAGYYAQHPEKDIVEIDVEDRIYIRTAIGGKGMTSSAGYAEHSIEKIFSS